MLAWLVASVLGGAPSTLHALATGGDALEATRAAGAMLVPIDTPLPRLIAAAAVVHLAVSAFWVAVFGALLPRRGVFWRALLAAAAVAPIDLKLVAPRWFPEVAALAFWPQFADHLAWGACIGAVLGWRVRRRAGRR